MDLLDMSYVSHVGKRKPLCVSYGGLLLEMDGGLPSTRQDSYLSGGTLSSVILCRFGMPKVHSDQGREFENKVMHELCILYWVGHTRRRRHLTTRRVMVWSNDLTEHY